MMMKKWNGILLATLLIGAGAARAKEGEGLHLAPGVGLGVLVEVEAAYEKIGAEESTDANVATFEVGLEAEPMEGVRGEAALLWEEGERDSVEVDSAFIELGGTEALPVAVSAGRIYLPFGAFNSFMVSDPLTLELGETRETAVALSGGWRTFTAWAGVFAGERDDAEDVENAAAALGWTPVEGLTLGVSVLSDLGEGAGYVDDLNDVLASEGSAEKAVGVSAFLLLERGAWSLAAELLGAVEDLEWTDAEGETTSVRPQAWHVDVAYAFNDAWSAAARYEGSKEFKADEMPEHQGGAAVFCQLNAFAVLGAEYLYGTFEDEEAGDRHLATIQLALEF
ncbi:MAG: LbtU family siderophore porin [Opitutae bacterium]|nr:LbtU family siderophore porin [Opitutae bacterium]